jgi:undecaprenyl-diphosphatase
MNDLFNAIVLGILQGVTEFLPVSSSGHLVLAQSLLPGFDAPAASFDVLLHGGTLLAVVAYFYRDLIEIGSRLRHPGEGGLRMPLLLVVGTIPAGLVGVLFQGAIEPLFSSPRAASIGLLVTAGLLVAAVISGKGDRRMEGLLLWQALLVGCFQALAILPGISRSGATIAIALLLGYSGTESARFSFLLSLPAVAGAMVLQAGDLFVTNAWGVYVAGALAAAASGWLSIAVLMRILHRGRLLPFALYCLALGSFSLVFLV